MKTVLLACLLVTLPLAADPLKVVSVIEPHAWLAREIGGARVEVVSLLAAGADPHSHSWRPSQMQTVAAANLLLLAGLWPEKQLRERVKGHSLDLELRAESSEAPEGDLHAWLDPLSLKQQAEAIEQVLAELDPEGRMHYRQRREALAARLLQFHETWRERFAPHVGRKLYLHHPALGHFCARYGLEQVSIESADHQVHPRHLAALARSIRSGDRVLVLVESTLSKRERQQIRAILNAQTLPFNPRQADVLANLEGLSQALIEHWEGL